MMPNAFNHVCETAAEICTKWGAAVKQNPLMLWSCARLAASVAPHRSACVEKGNA